MEFEVLGGIFLEELLESDNYDLLVEYDHEGGIDWDELVQLDLFGSNDERVIRYIFSRLGIDKITPEFLEERDITQITNRRLLFDYVKEYYDQDEIFEESWTFLSSDQIGALLPKLKKETIEKMIKEAEELHMDYIKQMLDEYLG